MERQLLELGVIDFLCAAAAARAVSLLGFGFGATAPSITPPVRTVVLPPS